MKLMIECLLLGVDECVNGSHSCSPNATCHRTALNYTCICDRGLTGNGFNCTGNIHHRNLNNIAKLN